MAAVALQRIGAGNYQTSDGRWKVERGAAGSGAWEGRWTVWDNQTETHADGRPFQFESMAAAREWLDGHA